MQERFSGARCRFFLPAVLLILGGLAVGSTSSLQAKSDKPDQKAEVKEKTVKFRAKEQPWRSLIEWLTEITGKPVNVDVEPKPNGAFTLIGPLDKEYTIPQVIAIINDALLTNNPKAYYLREDERSFTLMLADENNKRLKQIKLQLSVQVGGEAAVFTKPEVTKELRLSAAQQMKIKSILTDRRRALLPLFLKGEDNEEIDKKVTTHGKETFDQLLAVLNDSQRKQLKDLLGEPYWLLPAPKERCYANPLPGEPEGKRLQLNPSIALHGVLLANDKYVQEELKLTADHLKRLLEVRDRTKDRLELGLPGREEWEKGIGQQSADNEKALAEILEPKQLARFKQIVLQYFQAHSSMASISTEDPPSLLDHCAEVAKELQLTEKQQEQIDQGAKLADVLDEKQRAKLTEMLGKPFEIVVAIPLPPVLGGSRRGSLNESLEYLREQSVQEDLKLSAEQVRKIRELATEWEGKSRDASTTDQWTEVKEWLKKSLAGILDEKQVARLRQIELQQKQRGSHFLDPIYTDPDVAKALELTRDQFSSLRQLRRDHEQTRSLIRCELYGFVGEKLDPDFTRTMDEFNTIADKKLNAVLTPKQQQQLKALLGEPFKHDLRHGRDY